MMHRIWLIFTQAVAVAVAVLFVVATLKPEWLGRRTAFLPTATVIQAPSATAANEGASSPASSATGSLAAAACCSLAAMQAATVLR